MRSRSRPLLVVVDDDEHLREMLATALHFAGYEVHGAATVADGDALVQRHAPDLVVLDVQLPDGNGFELCRRWRVQGIEVPVLFLTARDQSTDVIAGFTDGGDDYVTKPFRLAELTLRIAAILRRTVAAAPHVLTAGDVVLDQLRHRVEVSGRPVELTPKEFDVLRFLLANRGGVVSKADIIRGAWQVEHVGDESLVETYVSRLRTKLGDEDAGLIRTVRGRGYIVDDGAALEGDTA